MTTIYLVRHGQASFGAESYDKLSPNGELQAKVLGQYFDKILKEAPYVIAGSMQRHQQTAHFALAESFPDVAVVTDHNWNEFNHQQVLLNMTRVLMNLICLNKMWLKKKSSGLFSQDF